jgi:ATP-binding cassette, subfamily C, bacterial LapB
MNTTVRADVLEDAGRASPNGLVEAFVEVASRHSHAIGVAEVLRRIPYDERGMTLAALREVAPALGFDVHLADMPLAAIPAIALPVILFDTDGHAMVLTRISGRRKQAHVIVPAAGSGERRIALGALAKQHAGLVAFLKPAAAPAVAGTGSQRARSGHWFWSTFRAFWRDYAQVVLAALLINVLGIVAPLFVKNVYDRVIPNLAIPTLWALTAGVLVALVLDIILRTLRSSIVDATGRRVDLAVAGRLFEHVLNLRLESRPASAGALASQLRDFDSVRDVMTSSTIIAVTDLCFIGIFIGVMWLLVGPLALVPLVAVAVVLLCAILIQFPLARAVKASQADSARRHGILVEAAGSIETIKSIGAEGQLRRSWNEAVAATSRTTTRARFWANLSANIVVFVNQAVAIATVVWGVFLVLDGTISVGSLIAASILSGRVLGPLGSIVQTLARALQAWSAFKTLDALMAAPAERTASGDGRSPRAGDIVLKNVSLTYPGASIAALDEVTVTIAKGERVGLIGRIGSGKTSVGRLLAGLYQPSSGQILIDGMDVRQFGADIRSLVGFCPQETELFSGTFRDNIVMGLPDASPAAFERAVQIAGVDAFAARQPLGLATPVAERGRSLSGGQRQAIGLARTLVRDPKILFLDEPSSAMDTATERALVASLKRELDSGITLLISTHRDGLLELVDRLIVFDGGRIILDGPKAEVIVRLREAAKTTPALVKETGVGGKAS